MRSLCLAVALALLPCTLSAQQPELASTPPMGWNSWDSYGFFISEPDFRANAQWIAKNLKPYGYQYVTIDEGWYESLPAPGQHDGTLHLDDYGRFIPAVDRFPSAADGKGLKPLADYIHSLGLKFGIHILNGIPKAAVDNNDPIADSTFFARDAANTHSTCRWDDKMYDLQDYPSSQAYYDSIAKLYASWGIDLIKIDCIASNPFKGEEIRMFHDAVARAGYPVVISLSPGPAPLDEAQNLERFSNQWRISNDIWDLWETHGDFPQGVNNQIARAAQWLPYAGPGHWPDADMLPLGELKPSPGWGKPRTTRLTPDEQRTMINLWAISRSPLIYGGDPLTTDAATLALLTNKDIIGIDQRSRNTKTPVLTQDLAVYTAQPDTGSGVYIAVFNRRDQAQTVALSWSELGISAPDGKQMLVDLWSKKSAAQGKSLQLKLEAHASTIFYLAPLTL